MHIQSCAAKGLRREVQMSPIQTANPNRDHLSPLVSPDITVTKAKPVSPNVDPVC